MARATGMRRRSMFRALALPPHPHGALAPITTMSAERNDAHLNLAHGAF